MQMTKESIENVLKALSKIYPISLQQEKDMTDRYLKMSDTEVIKELSFISYSLLKEKPEEYNYALEVIRNINPSVCPSISEMKEILVKAHKNEIEGNMELSENHKLISKTLIEITKLFNEYGIDYYLVGALPCYIKIGGELTRYHDDIDIMINENDIPKIVELLNILGYEFQDDRFPSIARCMEMQQKKPPHTVMAQNPNNEFHIGFFCFRREIDESITMREYSSSIQEGKVIVDVLERRTTPELTRLQYEEEPIFYGGSSFKMSSLESVYNIKQHTARPKDVYDIQNFAAHVNKEKVKQLLLNNPTNVVLNNVENIGEINVLR